MKRSTQAEKILAQIDEKTKLGDLRKTAKEIKKDHKLAMELWASERFLPRQLAILIMDNKQLSKAEIDRLDGDMQAHPFHERTHLSDWLMVNQLIKNKDIVAQIRSWQNSPSALQRRTFWYDQARQRWRGNVLPENTSDLLDIIEATITDEAPEVQWAMNFTAGWIGVFDKSNRARCVTIGEQTGLYKTEAVSKGCTPNYLPDFIEIESEKRNLQ